MSRATHARTAAAIALTLAATTAVFIVASLPWWVIAPNATGCATWAMSAYLWRRP